MKKSMQVLQQETGEDYQEMFQDIQNRLNGLLAEENYRGAIRYLRDIRPALREEDSAPLWAKVATTQRAQYPVMLQRVTQELRQFLAKGNIASATELIRGLKNVKPEDIAKLWRKFGKWFRKDLIKNSN
ncbi:MAG: hypothetical protein WC471_03740 [Candidatus Woesearchaeota archaeon]